MSQSPDLNLSHIGSPVRLVVEREWGNYKVLHTGEGFIVKELIINPRKRLSMQRHKYRSETWNLVVGQADIVTNLCTASDPFDGAFVHHLHKENPFVIPCNTWHQCRNDHDEPAHIVEIWKGPNDKLNESDIERYDPTPKDLQEAMEDYAEYCDKQMRLDF